MIRPIPKTGQRLSSGTVPWLVSVSDQNLAKPMLTQDSRSVAVTCFVVAFCSAVITAGIIGPQKEFHVSEEVSLLAITVFVVGFGIGMQ